MRIVSGTAVRSCQKWVTSGSTRQSDTIVGSLGGIRGNWTGQNDTSMNIDLEVASCGWILRGGTVLDAESGFRDLSETGYLVVDLIIVAVHLVTLKTRGMSEKRLPGCLKEDVVKQRSRRLKEGFEVVYGVGYRKTRKRFSRQNNTLPFWALPFPQDTRKFTNQPAVIGSLRKISIDAESPRLVYR
jgi:hypothetical protein